MLSQFNSAKSIMQSLTRLTVLHIKIHMPALRNISILVPFRGFWGHNHHTVSKN